MKVRMFEIMNNIELIDLSIIKKWLDKISCDYLCVKHDLDETRPHYHIFVKMNNAREIDDIAKQCNVEAQFIERIKKSWKNALGYAFHLTDSATEKHQYNENCIQFTNVDVREIFHNDVVIKERKAHNELIEELLIQYGNCECSKLDLINNMNAEDYNRYALMFKRMQEFRQMKVSERKMKVVYITGVSGSGKTTLAKYLARCMNYNVFISGSGKDVLDGYDKEECIILDDLRGDVFTKAELFKLTDNNTNSSVKSRFKNKDISQCKLMIITSIKAPSSLYDWNCDLVESYTQFARRLDFQYIFIDNGGVIYEKHISPVDFRISESKELPFNMYDVFKVLGIQKQFSDSFWNDINNRVIQEIETKNKELKDKEPKQLSIEELLK